ncbi:uncharacterized protein B0T23DRAFT_375948 [Neurospora hispaniola]|uniref:Uncharacterized protein n=1 Tax=Neurospora hispaniola TaxID=588809 RepID=A0AAJ0I960_9PEZI|nr:hypothetical protein B0T23DRAFT_375948 [Neurospora hispaniola]
MGLVQTTGIALAPFSLFFCTIFNPARPRYRSALLLCFFFPVSFFCPMCAFVGVFLALSSFFTFDFSNFYFAFLFYLSLGLHTWGP